MLFRAQLQGISRSAETDIPRGEAKLEIFLDRLDQYVRLAPPQTGEAAVRRAGGEPEAPSADEAGGRAGDAEPSST
jgi:hypothetical protein